MLHKGLTTILAWAAADPRGEQQTPQDMAKRVERALTDAGICVACFRTHPTYRCCQSCNYQVHHECHFCGDWLGHLGVSDCYEKCITCDHISYEHYSEKCRKVGATCTAPTFRTGVGWLVRELDRQPVLMWALLHAVNEETVIRVDVDAENVEKKIAAITEELDD
jgi:hypothetical protein